MLIYVPKHKENHVHTHKYTHIQTHNNIQICKRINRYRYTVSDIHYYIYI